MYKKVSVSQVMYKKSLKINNYTPKLIVKFEAPEKFRIGTDDVTPVLSLAGGAFSSPLAAGSTLSTSNLGFLACKFVLLFSTSDVCFLKLSVILL